jgi:hypothetical protein
MAQTYANAEGRGFNKLSGKSVDGEDLAPQVGLEPTTLRLTVRRNGADRQWEENPSM